MECGPERIFLEKNVLEYVLAHAIRFRNKEWSLDPKDCVSVSDLQQPIQNRQGTPVSLACLVDVTSRLRELNFLVGSETQVQLNPNGKELYHELFLQMCERFININYR